MKNFPLIRKLGTRSIRTEIAVAFSFLILLTALLIGLLSYWMWMKSVQKETRDYSLQLIQQVNDNIGSYITYMENVSDLIISNSDVQTYLRMDTMNAADQSAGKSIASQFGSILSERNDITNIIILGSNGNIIINGKDSELNPYVDPSAQDWYRKAIAAQGKPVISSSYVQNIVRGNYPWVVSLSRSILDGNGNAIGVLLVDLNYSVINDMCAKINLGQRGYVFIVDNHGNIVYHPQQQLIYSGLKTEAIDEVLKVGGNSFVSSRDGEQKEYSVINSDSTGWKIVGVTYVDELVPDRRQMQAYYFLGITLLLAVVVFLSIFYSYRVTRPIKDLERSMQEVEKGNFDVRVDVRPSKEIVSLGKAFNIMTAKIKELMRQNTVEQELKRKSELKAMQTQINPHFLYNTLDSIIWMAEDKRADEVVMMTSALAKMFRMSISTKDELTTVYNEIEHIKSYLTIQKMRYGEKLDFEIRINEDVLEYKVIKILLQPLVENAIYHGIKPKPEGGKITVTGRKEGSEILLEIIDDGVGMTPEEVKNLNEGTIVSRTGSGVGVTNIHERIRLYFGSGYGLHFSSGSGLGTIAVIRLPAVR